MTSEELIETLCLEPHPLEGGYFRRIYQSDTPLQTPVGERHLATAIHYLLTAQSPLGLLHKNASDILHFHQLGCAITYYVISPDAQCQRYVLGPDLAAGQQLQLLVPGGSWKATELTAGDFGLISEVVMPGFEYADNSLAQPADIALWPQELQQRLGHLMADF